MSTIASTQVNAEFERVARARRSIYFFQPTPVPRAVIEWAIRMAMLAPNHYKTRPWRFHVFEGEGRETLARAFEQGAVSIDQDPARARTKIYPAPATIVITSQSDPDHPKALIPEDHLATAAAVENLLLAFASVGVGTIWGTGRLIRTEAVRLAVGLTKPHDEIIGAITVGYADTERSLPERRDEPTEGIVHWRD